MNTVPRRRTWLAIAPAAVLVVSIGSMAALSAWDGIRGESTPAEAVPATVFFGSFAVLLAWFIGRALSVSIIADGLQIWNVGRLELVRWMHLRLRKENRGRMVLESAERTFPIMLTLYAEPAAAREFVLANLGLPIQFVALPNRQARRRSLVITIAVPIVFTLCAWALVRARPKVVSLGDPAPAITAKDLMSGTGVSLSPLSSDGRALVLSFWAVSCEYCTAQLVALDSVQSIAGSNVRVVAIHVFPGDVAAARRLVKRLKLGVETWQDTDRVVERRYGLQGTPTTIVIGPAGCIEYFVTGTGGVEVSRLSRAAAHAAAEGLTSTCGRRALRSRRS